MRHYRRRALKLSIVGQYQHFIACYTYYGVLYSTLDNEHFKRQEDVYQILRDGEYRAKLKYYTEKKLLMLIKSRATRQSITRASKYGLR